MNYKQSVLNNNNSNIRKQNLNITASEKQSYKDVKHCKAINFALVGSKSTAENKEEISYTRPLRVIVLQFYTLEKFKESYSIDVSGFFNKPSKSVILKHSKQNKISKQFAHWIRPYGVLKHRSRQGEFGNINNIVGSDISMNEYELYIDQKNGIPLTKSHISYIVAQTLCKTHYINKSYQVSYTEHAGVIGAFILKNRGYTNFVNPTVIGYYISDYELKQCALANFTKKQTIEVGEWSSFSKLPKRRKKFDNLLGDTATSNELVRSSVLLTGDQLVNTLQSIASVCTLNSCKRPLLQLVNLLTKIQHLFYQ